MMVKYTVARFGGCEPITGEDVGKLGKELLDRRWSGEEKGTREGRLRRGRGVKNYGIWVVNRDYFMSIGFDKKIKMLQKNQPPGEELILEQDGMSRSKL